MEGQRTKGDCEAGDFQVPSLEPRSTETRSGRSADDEWHLCCLRSHGSFD